MVLVVTNVQYTVSNNKLPLGITNFKMYVLHTAWGLEINPTHNINMNSVHTFFFKIKLAVTYWSWVTQTHNKHVLVCLRCWIICLSTDVCVNVALMQVQWRNV